MDSEVLLLGATGLLGSDVAAAMRGRGWLVRTPTRDELDLADPRSIEAYFLSESPAWIVNCAAYTNVDLAESERDQAFVLNASAPFSLARFSRWKRARLLHISTDFVFDGAKSTPYVETDDTSPIGVYGESKRHGEKMVFEENPAAIVVRTSWLFGTSGKCFPKTIFGAAAAGKALRVVDDQRGSPTYTSDLASALCDFILKEPEGGVYHVASSGEGTWFDLARETLAASGLSNEVTPISTADWPTPARRPAYSVLSTAKYQSLGLPALPDWRDAIARFAKALKTRD
jgi:dTDP-4-dehydrorhamnose reductase